MQHAIGNRPLILKIILKISIANWFKEAERTNVMNDKWSKRKWQGPLTIDQRIITIANGMASLALIGSATVTDFFHNHICKIAALKWAKSS